MKKETSNKYLKAISALTAEGQGYRAIASFVRNHRMPSLEATAAALGISEILSEELPFDGGIFESDGKLLIKLNTLAPPRRRRFTLAHEIGHLLLAGKFRSKKECTGNRALEDACNAIAAELLMPSDDADAFHSDKRFVSPTALVAAAEHFDVSLQAAARRALDLQLTKGAIGLWEGDTHLTERWLVGTRQWSGKQPFTAFIEAQREKGLIHRREWCSKGEEMITVSVHALAIGHQWILATIV